MSQPTVLLPTDPPAPEPALPAGQTLLNSQADPSTKLLQDAAKQYPFVSRFGAKVIITPSNDGGDLLETWPKGETGTPDRPRPPSLPLNQVGIQVFKPGQVGPSDIAADLLHVDPVARQAADKLRASLTPDQISTLKRSAEDYSVSLKGGESEAKALDNAVYSAMRGYAAGQWSAKDNAQMQYTPAQKALLDGLKRHMTGAP